MVLLLVLCRLMNSKSNNSSSLGDQCGDIRGHVERVRED